MPNTASQLDLHEELIGDLPPKPLPMSSLVAAAQRLTKKKLKRMGHRAKAEGWQEDAWDMYDLVGEQRFLAATLANRMAQARFYVGQLPEDTTEDLLKVEDGPAYEAFDSLIGKGSHFNQMVGRTGLNLFMPGDCYLLGCPHEEVKSALAPVVNITPFGQEDEDTDPLAGIDLATLDWQAYSLSELSVDDKTGVITVDRDGKKKYDADNVVLIRVWRPHPNKWEKADSPTRSSLPVLRELVGLTMHISAQVDSRLAGAGILFIPASADRAMRAAAGATGEDDTSPFADALMEAMIQPISDRSNASAVVPLMPVVPDESIEKFKFMSFSGPLDKEARSLRDEAIRRLALGQDCPPELLLGVAGMNHWGAWLVREDVVTTHLEPPLALICDAITSQFLWPVLEQQGVENFQDFVIWYDVEHLIQRPNKAQDAKDAHTAGVIGDGALRDALGFDDEDAPEVDPTDPVVALIIKMVQEAPTLALNPGLGVLADQLREVLAGRSPAAPAAPAEEEPVADEQPDQEEQPQEGGMPATNDAEAPPVE